MNSAKSYFGAQLRFATDKWWQNFRFCRIFVSCFVHEEGCLSWFYKTSTINTSQFIETLKVKMTSLCDCLYNELHSLQSSFILKLH